MPTEPSVAIRGDVAYPIEQLKPFGIGTQALRTARRGGLPVRRLGRRSYVLGEDLIAYLKEHAKVVS